MNEHIDGIYAAYLSGKAGSGFAMLLFKDGKIAGADALGITFDGSFEVESNRETVLRVSVKSPPNVPLIQGGMTGPEGDAYEMLARLPANFASEEFVRIETRYGPLNARLTKLRDLNG